MLTCSLVLDPMPSRRPKAPCRKFFLDEERADFPDTDMGGELESSVHRDLRESKYMKAITNQPVALSTGRETLDSSLQSMKN